MGRLSKESPLLIAGTGAMACLFAARLSAAGIPVIMLGGWAAGVDAIRRSGVRLVDQDGGEKSYPVRVATHSSECTGIREALVLVKSWQTGEAGRKLSQCLTEDGLVLTLQNGLGNREALAQHLGEERVALGITTTGANLLAPGQVRFAGEGVTTLSDHPRIMPLADKLRSAGFVVEMTPDATGLIWGKLVINAAINPLTALLMVPNGELIERPGARQLMAAAALETAAVAAAQGIHLPFPDPVSAVEAVAQRTAKNLSSMFKDVERGAPTEVDAINGAIVKAGAKYNVPTPINHTLWLLVRAKVNVKGQI